MAYATLSDVQSRMTRTLSQTEQAVVTTLLDDAAVIIDAYKESAAANAKKIVSCRMVARAIGSGDSDIPMGATQGSMSAMGYSQSWSMATGSTVGELYISSAEKKILGGGNLIGSHSPVEDLCEE